MEKKLTNIFNMLDSEKNQYISPFHIDLDQIPTEIVMVLKPMLLEMEEFQVTLDLEEFIESALALLKNETLENRNLILNFGRR